MKAIHISFNFFSYPDGRVATHRDGASVVELDAVLPHRGAKDERAGGVLAHLEDQLCEVG